MNLNTEQYFSEIPRIHTNRSVFDRSFTHKTTMNVNKVYPIFIDEALPGDTFKLKFQAFGRLQNPLTVPIMDELYFETLWFKSPMRLLWNNTFKFFGERENPDDSTDYVIPTVNSGDNGFPVGSIFDHFGVPPLIANVDINSLPLRMYNRLCNEWLRDQNLVNSLPLPLDDEDSADNYTLFTSAKMHDLFTSALPTSQLGEPVNIPLGNTAPVSVYGNGKDMYFTNAVHTQTAVANHTSLYQAQNYMAGASTLGGSGSWLKLATDPANSGITGLADLSQATGININDLRFFIKLQQYREKMLTGGHRYREIVSNFFDVDQLDNRAYVTEFLGMTREMVDINTVIQTSATDSVTPQGNLTAYGVVNAHESGFTTSFVEHSYVMGVARFRHNPVYQQGLNKLWSRSTQLDFYNPMFNGLGEQPILNKEIMLQGNNVLADDGEPVDEKAFGFNEFAYEYRFYPSLITGQLRSGIPNTLDYYHLAQYFGTVTEESGQAPVYTPVLPVLNESFISENIPLDRALSVKSDESKGIIQFIMDFRFEYECIRPMPVRNIPAGLYSGI